MGSCQSRPKSSRNNEVATNRQEGPHKLASAEASIHCQSNGLAIHEQSKSLRKITEGVAKSPSSPSRRKSSRASKKVVSPSVKSGSASYADNSTGIEASLSNDADAKLIVGDPVEPRRLWFGPPTSEKDLDEDDDEEYDEIPPVNSLDEDDDELRVDEVIPENSEIMPSVLDQGMGFAPIRSTIPEEEDPEMPSDEEDYTEELKRSQTKEEPGRLLPVKMRSKPTARVSSVLVAGQRSEAPPVMSPGDKSSVHIQTLSDFQRLKLQVKLQKRQDMKEKKVNRVEDRIEDADTHRKLWQQYQEAERELARMESEMNADPKTRLLRTDSFDLNDANSWFFDFKGADFKTAVDADDIDDNASHENLSLLSEQSLDAQRRYYSEKRKERKAKKKLSKLERRLQKDRKSKSSRSLQRSDSGLMTPEGAGRLNMGGSVCSGISRDYGPVRSNSSAAPIELEISYQQRESGYSSDLNDPNKDDAGSYVGSYVSDLGDESYTGGAWGGSQAGQSQYTYGSASNDYGVRRRLRRGDSSSRLMKKERQTMESKLQSLENALAKMQKDDKTKSSNAQALAATSEPQPRESFESIKTELKHEAESPGAMSDATTPRRTTSRKRYISPPQEKNSAGLYTMSTTGDESDTEEGPEGVEIRLDAVAAVTPSPASAHSATPASEDSGFAFLRASANTSATLISTYQPNGAVLRADSHSQVNDSKDIMSIATVPVQSYDEHESPMRVSSPDVNRHVEEKKEDIGDSSHKEDLHVVTSISPKKAQELEGRKPKISNARRFGSLLMAKRSTKKPSFTTPPPAPKHETQTRSSFWKESVDMSFIPERTNVTPDTSVPENRVSGKSFWTKDMFNFIPERTNISPDEANRNFPNEKKSLVTPGKVSEGMEESRLAAVTPMTSASTPPKDDENFMDDEESPEAHLARTIKLRSQVKKSFSPDPDGRRIDASSRVDASESLRLAEQVEAQVSAVLSNFRESSY